MSFFGDFTFFLYLLLALIPAVILGLCEKPLRHYTLFLSALFIILIFGAKPVQLLYLVSYYAAESVLVKLYLFLRIKYGRKVWLYRVFLALSLLPLVINKCGSIAHLNILGFLGISYLTFRVLQVIIEIYDGVITAVPFVEFTSFLLFFPALSSGPIDRSRRFHDDYIQTRTRHEYLELVGDGIFKILLGMVYKFVLAAVFSGWTDYAETQPLWYYTIIYAYCYGLHMFFDFAGYSLMAVGTSYLLGVRTPDNFRLPFISKDIKEFWDRWHITLSHWFRDFIFSRFIMDSIRKKRFKTKLTGASCGFIINMLVMGMWHGLTFSYILYGLYHGILLALTEIFQKKSKFYKKFKKKTWYQIGSWFLTMQLVMFGFFIFSGRFAELLLH